MRWTLPKHGTTRVRWIFPLKPLTLNREAVWLQLCRVVEVYIDDRYGWKPLRFTDQPHEPAPDGYGIDSDGNVRPWHKPPKGGTLTRHMRALIESENMKRHARKNNQ